MSLVSDVGAHTGRSFGPCDAVYVDGALITSELQLNAGSRVVQRGPIGFRKRGIDAILHPDDIQGMEMYRTADAPAQYRRPAPRGCPPDMNVVLIWLK